MNPLYDPDLNKPWWELAWNAVVAWFASVVQWFNNLDVGWKIGIGLALFALACIITALTAGLSGGAAAIAPALLKVFLDFAIGVVSAFAFTAISMAITGDFSLETLGGAVADAIFWGGVFAFVSASVNAVKTVARTYAQGGKACDVVGQCFIAGTLVLCMDENGNECHKPIEDIKVGDMVWAYDEETSESDWKPVVRLFRNETKEWYHIFVNGEEIVCTGGHPFYVVGEGFVKAKDLKISDKLLLSSGKCVTIEEIQVEQLATPETTYNFEVEDFHTYYVTESKVLVHNLCERAAMRAAKRSENIPMNQKPDEVILEKAVRGADGKYYKPITYRYGNKFIRNDFGGHLFSDGVTMGSHFNAGSIIDGKFVGNNLHFFYGG